MNKTEKKSVFNTFIKEYFDLLSFIKIHSENNSDFNKFYYKNIILKKANIKLFIKTWHEHITIKYFEPIMNENVDFFLNKNYTKETTYLNNEFNILYYISKFKELFNNIEEQIVKSFVLKIKTLTQLTYIYYCA
tara:strand:- start:229 stop:630 length:402 start_codon:yes stop_codon:yes gene_type:complete